MRPNPDRWGAEGMGLHAADGKGFGGQARVIGLIGIGADTIDRDAQAVTIVDPAGEHWVIDPDIHRASRWYEHHHGGTGGVAGRAGDQRHTVTCIETQGGLIGIGSAIGLRDGHDP